MTRWGPLGLVDLDDPPLSLADTAIQLGEAFLRVPSGPKTGDDLVLSEEQVEFLWAWYAVTPDGRRYLYRRSHLEGPKGWSKSPVGGFVAFAELVGDVVPDGLDAWRRPVGRPHPRPMVQVAGVSIDGTDNLYGQLFEALRDSPAVEAFGLDVGLTKITRAGGGEITPVTASSQSRTGNPGLSLILREETWLWTWQNGGRTLAATLNQNARKAGARILDLTNTPIMGQASVAEQTLEREVKARASGRDTRTLTVRVRLPERLEDIQDDDAARAALVRVYGSHCTDNGGWVDVDELMDDRPPGETTENEWRRLYLGEDVADAEAVLDAGWARRALMPAELAEGDRVALGFDGSDSSDATAIYLVRWPDWVLFKWRVWERPRDVQGRPVRGWKVPRLEVRAELRRVATTFRVVRGYCDPAYWETDLDQLAEEFGTAFVRFPHHSDSKIGPACARWATMTGEGGDRDAEVPELRLAIDPDPLVEGVPDLVRHAANARRVKCGPARSNWWRPVRRHDGHPIDAFSAAVSAVHALGDAIQAGDVADSEEFADDFAEVI